MRLYIYLLDFLARISAFQRRIGWNQVDYILLAVTVCWATLLALSNCYAGEPWVPIFQGTIFLVCWAAQAYSKYLRNWRKNYPVGPSSLEAPRGSDVED